MGLFDITRDQMYLILAAMLILIPGGLAAEVVYPGLMVATSAVLMLGGFMLFFSILMKQSIREIRVEIERVKEP